MKTHKIGSMIIALAMMLSLGTSAFATSSEPEEYQARTMVPQTTYYWTYTTKSAGTSTAGSWKLFYEGEPATQAGESDTATCGVTYNHTYSGSIAAEVKSKIEVQFGYTFGEDEEFSVSKQSRTLAKGEYIKAYYIKTYEDTTVNQTQYKRVRGWQQTTPGGSYEYVDKTSKTGATKTATAKKAILPKIKLNYYTSKKTAANVCGLEEMPIATEVYEYINGQYVLTETR